MNQYRVAIKWLTRWWVAVLLLIVCREAPVGAAVLMTGCGALLAVAAFLADALDDYKEPGP